MALSLKTRRRIKELISSRLTAVLLFVLLLLMVGPVWNMYARYVESREARLSAEEQVESIAARKEKVGQEIEYLQSEIGREEELRRRFVAGRDGERVAIILDGSSGQVTEEDVRKEGGIWRRVRDFLWGLVFFVE